MKCEIWARADVNPTEDRDKVIEAISNLLDYYEIEVGDDYVCASGEMETIKNLGEELKERRIRGAARIMMLKGSGKGIIQFKLSKQAAYAGVLNLVEEHLSPLGEIEVTIKTRDTQKLIDTIAPMIQ